MPMLRRTHLAKLCGSRSLSSPIHYRLASNGLTVGIRREDPGRIWERRCPLTPEAVNELVEKEGVRVLVQPCERRVFTMREMTEAGAIPHDTLAPSHVLLGIKETPLKEVLNDPAPLNGAEVPRTHLMFSHTHKGQEYNTELLSKFVSPSLSRDAEPIRPRLIDYELLTDEDGKRTVGFGWFAGVAGALESLSALAHAHLEIGIASPFLSTPRPHTHPTLPSLIEALKKLVGDRIASEGTPAALGPVVIGVTGTGKVAQGALDLLAELPIQKVSVDELPRLVRDPNTDLRKLRILNPTLIYVVHALPKDYFVRTDGGSYERSHYYEHPDTYRTVFHERVAPYLTLLLNGAGWGRGFPRLMDNTQLAHALEAAQSVGKARFTCVGDISCDIEGGLEFLPRSSTLSDPYFKTRPEGLPAHLPSITMMAVDILPTGLPRDASAHFSKVLMPYLRTVIQQYRDPAQADEKLSAALEKATIADGGVLREDHRWLYEPLSAWHAQASTKKEAHALPEKRKKVLMLGSGMVAGPAVDEIARHGDVELIVASNSLPEAQKLVAEYPNASAVLLDVHNQADVAQLVAQSDLVISLLPVPFHPSVADLCLKHRKHLVTASYISPAMRALHERAVAADVLLLNEIGLDPGIDHCSAIALLEEIRAQGKRVASFTSFCGGLPAPECADVPLKYKFSWSPRGVLGAALNGARFKLWGEVKEIDGKDILRQGFPEFPASDVLKLEGIANRDSLPYAETYNLGPVDGLRTLVRGTIRFPGFSSLMHAFKTIGLLDLDAHLALTAWSDLTRAALQHTLRTPVPADAASLRAAIAQLVPPHDVDAVLGALAWFGIAPGSEALLDIPLPKAPVAPIDAFTAVLARRLRYEQGERDLVVLHHEIVAVPGGPAVSGDPVAQAAPSNEEVYTSSLVTYGTPRASAMARTVGIPLALAARAVLSGNVSARGVHGPGVERAVYGRVLEGLNEIGLGMKEWKSLTREGGGRVERGLLVKA